MQNIHNTPQKNPQYNWSNTTPLNKYIELSTPQLQTESEFSTEQVKRFASHWLIE